MLSVAEALEQIIRVVTPAAAVSLPLTDCRGLVLAEEICADLDSPPFDKALMDGYAFRSEDLRSVAASDGGDGRLRLQVLEEVTAGRLPTQPVRPGTAIRIMTGSPLPQGADAVVPVELTELISQDGAVLPSAAGWPMTASGEGGPRPVVSLPRTGLVAEQNILRQGASVRRGQTVLSPGICLGPQQIGALAELGRSRVQVVPRPKVAVLATGDELVPFDAVPGPGQIRNSNEIMLVAQLAAAGAVPVSLGIARDQRDDLVEKVQAGLACDLLLLSGGVSAGVLDLVPSALRECGVEQVFHKVRIRPGQPLWFGVREPLPAGPDSPARTYVFGLPGNPVSGMVCCELFVRTAIRAWMGFQPAPPSAMTAVLTQPFTHRGARPTYHPAAWEWGPGGISVRTVPWVGSADLCATTAANGMVHFPAGDAQYDIGTRVPLFPW